MTSIQIDEDRTSVDDDCVTDGHDFIGVLDVGSALGENKDEAAQTPCPPVPSWESLNEDAGKMIAGHQPEVQEMVPRFQGGSPKSRGGRRSSSVDPADRLNSPPKEIRFPRSTSAHHLSTDSNIPTTLREELLPLACVSSRSSESPKLLDKKSPTSLDQIMSLSQLEADVSLSNNDTAKANSSIRYEIGQELLDSSHSIPFRSSSEASALLKKLPLDSPLFVRRTSGEWTFALLLGRRTDRRGKPSLMVDFTKDDGWKKKVLRKNRWGGDLMLVNQEVVSWDRPPVASLNAGGHPTERASGPSKREKPRWTSRRLEAELRLYKLKNKNRDLTEQCRELSDQLAEVDSKLELAQARAAEAELLREVSTEKTDGRLDALRALAKTTKVLKRENKKVGEERDLLKSKLEEADVAKAGLEVRLAAEHAKGVLDAVDGVRCTRPKEAKSLSSDERTKSVVELESEKQCLQDCIDIVVEKMKNLQSDLDTALDSKQVAEAARDSAMAAVEASKTAEGAAVQKAEELRAQIATHKEANLAAAAKSKAREVEMKAEVEHMRESLNRKELEINAVKLLIDEKDALIGRLEAELRTAKQELLSFTENFEAENNEALQRVADRDYFDGDELLDLSYSVPNFSLASGKSMQGLKRGLLQKGTNHARKKDARINELEKSLSDKKLSISNLRNQLVSVTARYKEDESQLKMLIENLEEENERYSIKLEVLESKFKEVGGWQEVNVFGQGNDSLDIEVGDEESMCSESIYSQYSQGTSLTQGLSLSCSSSWVSSMTGASSRKHDWKNKNMGTRIASLQTQLCEMQQRVPGLGSKRIPQVEKREEALEEERKHEEEISRLRKHNEQLQMVTRGMLQNFDTERQELIEELNMRLGAREATIKKLEAEALRRKSMGRKGVKKIRGKKKIRGCEV